MGLASSCRFVHFQSCPPPLPYSYRNTTRKAAPIWRALFYWLATLRFAFLQSTQHRFYVQKASGNDVEHTCPNKYSKHLLQQRSTKMPDLAVFCNGGRSCLPFSNCIYALKQKSLKRCWPLSERPHQSTASRSVLMEVVLDIPWFSVLLLTGGEACARLPSWICQVDFPKTPHCLN